MIQISPSKSKVHAYFSAMAAAYPQHPYITSVIGSLLQQIDKGDFVSTTCRAGELSSHILCNQLHHELEKTWEEDEASDELLDAFAELRRIIKDFMILLEGDAFDSYGTYPDAYEKDAVIRWIDEQHQNWSAFFFHAPDGQLQNHITFLQKFRLYVSNSKRLETRSVSVWLQAYCREQTIATGGRMVAMLVNSFKEEAEEGTFDDE